MKQKFYLPLIAAVAVGSFAFSYANTQTPQASNQSLANVEALTEIELPEVTIECGNYHGACYTPMPSPSNPEKTICDYTGYVTDYC